MDVVRGTRRSHSCDVCVGRTEGWTASLLQFHTSVGFLLTFLLWFSLQTRRQTELNQFHSTAGRWFRVCVCIHVYCACTFMFLHALCVCVCVCVCDSLHTWSIGLIHLPLRSTSYTQNYKCISVWEHAYWHPVVWIWFVVQINMRVVNRVCYLFYERDGERRREALLHVDYLFTSLQNNGGDVKRLKREKGKRQIGQKEQIWRCVCVCVCVCVYSMRCIRSFSGQTQQCYTNIPDSLTVVAAPSVWTLKLI